MSILMVNHNRYTRQFVKKAGPNFKKLPRRLARLQGLNLRGPSASNSEKSTEYPLLEERLYETALNDRSDSKLKEDITNLASTSVLSRRNKLSDQQDGIHDIRFFAELVKPLQYRLRVGRKAQKVITPSKHGYHPRSQSPTFKRLVEATEKLQVFAENDSSTERHSTARSDGISIRSMYETPKKSFMLPPYSNVLSCSETGHVTNVSQEETPRTALVDLRDLEIPKEYPPDNAISEEDDESETTGSEKSEAYFKVDFRSSESHAELHLFLPQINYSSKYRDRLGTPSDTFRNITGKDGQTKLPSIARSGNNMNSAKIYGGYRKSRKIDIQKKKKRKIERCPSAADNDSRIRDHLNDVPTLISLQKDHKHPKESACPFDYCPYHRDEHGHNH